MADNKIVKYKKPISPIIWKILVFLLIIYTFILLLTYTSKAHITIYEVSNAKIADDKTWEGIILRNEKIFTTKNPGNINYFNPAGNRVGVGDIIYTIDSNGDIADLLADIDNSPVSTNNEIANMRNVISSFQDNFSFSHYGEVYDYRYEIENITFEQSKENLYSDLEKALKKNGRENTFFKINANNSGIISYTLDGFESLKKKNINNEILKSKDSLTRTQLREKKIVEINDPIYKLVLDENWMIVVPINQAYYEKLKNKNSVKVKIKKDNITFNAILELDKKNDEYHAILYTNKFMQRYLYDRFLEIEFSINSAQGLKIPNSSIIEKEFFIINEKYIVSGGNGETGFTKVNYKEMSSKNSSSSSKNPSDDSKEFEFIPLKNSIHLDGFYYVSKDLLSAGDILVTQDLGNDFTVSTTRNISGVYRVNEGFCKFVRIEKEYENAEYSIIMDNTETGLNLYDHIVVEPYLLNENDILY